MDPERRARRQSRRVIISEIIMFLTVVITVVILALLVSGYWLNGNFEVERQGMLQIHSMPTGASVEVDGDAPWFQRTNTSKVLKSGEHKIVLTKDGYDSWEKTVSINEGLLYRVNYPRLFLLEREKSNFYDAKGTIFATISPDHNLILLANGTTVWQLLQLDTDTAKATKIDISKTISAAGFKGEVLSANWDSACEHVLLEVKNPTHEWLLLDVKNPEKSLNLTREFASDFDEIRIFDNSANNLLALKGDNLHKIDVSGRQISAILAKNVKSYDFYGPEIIFATNESIELMRIGDDKTTLLASIDAPTRPYISRFYDDKYITLVTGDMVKLYRKDNFEEVLIDTLTFTPETIKIGHDGSFVFFQSGTSVAILDMEIMSASEWQLDSSDSGWLDGSMLYSIKDGTLIVYDFDGLNRRELSDDLDADSVVTITNNKWLYYFSDGDIIREVIAQ